MIIKTAIALFLTASLAGGAVYYGTQGDVRQNGEVSLGEHPHKKTETSVEIDEDEIEAVEEIEPAAPNTSTIDRLLNRNSESEKNEEAWDKDLDTSATTTTETTVTEIIETVDVEDVQAEEVEMPEATVENVGEVQMADDIYDVAMAQAERIETPDIRDQAYLDIIDYACKNTDYSRAQATTAKIAKVQMRDKARSRIAISMAQGGLASMAFAEIDKVETKKSVDVMRLQVLQALVQK